MHRRTVLRSAAVIAAVTAAIATVPVFAPAAAHAEDGASAVTWSVAPADEHGADGRAGVDLELDPGATATERLVVRNLGEEEVRFSLTAADGYLTPAGRFNMLPSDQASVDAGSWISLAPEVVVPAGGSSVVPFTVTVPEDATPGNHAAGVAASITALSSGDGARVGVESRVGLRVTTRVTGEIAPGLAVVGDGGYRLSWNPFAPGSVEVVAQLENTGNVRLAVEPSLATGGRSIPATGLEPGRTVELLPGDRRTVSFTVPGAWPLGPITLPVTAEATTVGPNGAGAALAPVVRTVTVWALPIAQLAALLALVLIALGAAAGRSRRSKRVEQLVSAAREAGRREVVGAGGPT
ncbi:protein of unknown function [Agromyces sp. CF514]|uniref:DUF916 domain-containing protein n=1 Tax=Agromyces sp. CF514 TaxID=1881031 RepID=UPI0008EF69AD|nr:DUF916 domain-containing protein [Agromyces sp. CF514]SFR82831.1 protein of unknown function [Agromyces sp. CF514]